MATLDDIVAASKILDEESETLMGGSGSKLDGNQGRICDVKKDDVSSAAAAVVRKRIVETGTVVESTFDSSSVLGSGLGDTEKVKIGVGNLSNDDTGVSVKGIDDNVGVNGSLDLVIQKDKKIEDEEGSRADDGRSVGSDCKKSNGGGRNCSNADVDGDGKGQGDGEDWDHGFRVGDFVWGKIKSHPWWPGQVYDPRDASEFALKHSQEGRLLVAFFGDGSCSWCLPCQLIPFVENFEEMSTDSSSKSLLNAVQRAIDEVGRLMESEMTCECTPEEKREGLARPVVANAGVKPGVLMPEVELDRLSIPKYGPAEILSKLMHFAKAVSVGNAVELAVLRSWLSAFFRSKGVYQLPVYHESLHIEGLEDENKTVTAVADDFSVPIEVPILGPQDDDWLSSPAVDTAKSQASSDDKIYHRRKQKSVAELMGENTNVKPKSQKRATVKEGTDVEKSSSSLKRKKSNDGEVEGVGSQGASSAGKRGKKRKVEVSESAKTTDKKEIEVAAAGNTSGEAKEESEMMSSPRERKKSKYLSPPYTNLSWRMGNSSTKMESEIESDQNAKRAYGDIPVSPPVLKIVNKESEENLPNEQLESPKTVESDKKMPFSVDDVNVPVNDLLSEIQFAALEPLYLSKEGSFDKVWAFVSALRSSTYLHGPNYKIYQKCITGRKRKSLPSHLGNHENEPTGKKAKTLDQKTPTAMKTGGKSDTTSKSKKAAEISHGKSSAEKLEGNASPCLSLTFTPGFPLPSKEEIVKLFSKFGSLNEKETNVITDSNAVQIVYMKDSDAEAAFKSSVSQSPFSVEHVNYWLQHSSAPKISSPRKRTTEKPESSSQPIDDFMMDVRVVKQKLEIMTAILENYHSKFSAEDKSSLKDEMKHLMEKVETASEKVRVMAENTSS